MPPVEAPAHISGLLAALCDRLDDPILVVTPQRRVLWLNAAARDLFGSPVDAVGRPLAEVAGDYRIALLVTAAFERQTEVGDELTDVLGARTVVARAIPIGGQGNLHVAVVLRDQTRLRQLETVRRDFVANVSHELRTPVTAIHLLVETLQNGALGEPEEAAQFVERIGLEVAHLRQMVDELLELSLMEAGERLVVRNLVHNAIKFTPRGGAVTVRAAKRGSGFVALQVCDTGVGITADALPRIFERFYKADRSRQRDGDGAGLGLAIARHTVEAHGGRIDVESETAHGTTFTVVLPSR